MVIFRTNPFSMTPRQVQEAIEKGGQAASYIAGNQTEAVQTLTNGAAELTKRALTAENGKRIGYSIFKGTKDYARGDTLCTGLCVTSTICETASAVIIRVPGFPAKYCTLSALKAVSCCSMKIRNLCAAEPNNPLC